MNVEPASSGPRERCIFVEALEREDPAAREAFLEAACAGNAALRQRLELMLSEHAHLGDFLESGRESSPDRPSRGSAVEPSALGESAGDRIGRYKLLERIGEGGCGVVYVAEQQEPVRRQVALKIIKLGMDTRRVVARFEAERQALALMDHPHIAKVLDGGATETHISHVTVPIPGGRPYFVMELVRGVRITQFCRDYGLSIRERLRLMIQVCRAIQHAHQKGIVHRDLKPSNILVAYDESASVGVPKVIDFGIAKVATGECLTDKTVYTGFEQFIGTPAYMSPEQVALTNGDVDTRSDIYSLGVLLYELLTGKTPFDTQELLACGWDGMQKTILERQPQRPSACLRHAEGSMAAAGRSSSTLKTRNWRSEIPADLDWIVMKCLEKDRSRRYETANGLAMDLERFLASEPVLARPPSTAYRLSKFVQRHRLTALSAAAVLVTLAVGIILSTRQAVRARRALERAEISERRAEHARVQQAVLRHQAQAQAYASDMKLAQQTLGRNDLGGVLAILKRYEPEPGEFDFRGWEWRFLRLQAQGDAYTLAARLDHEVHSLAISSDGQWLAAGELEAGDVSLFHGPTFLPVKRMPAGRAGVHVAFARYRPLLAYSGWSEPGLNRVTLWNHISQQAVADLSLAGLCQGLVFSGQDDVLGVFMSDPHQLVVWEVDRAQKRLTIDAPQTGHYHHAFALCWERRKAAVSGPKRGQLRVIGVETGEDLWQADAGGDQVTALAFSPDGALLACGTGFDGGGLQVWDVARGVIRSRLEGHSSWITALAFWPDGGRLASASADQTIRLWEFPAPAQARSARLLRGHQSEVAALTFTPHPHQLLSGSSDGRVHLWPSQPESAAPMEMEIPIEVMAWGFGNDQQSVLTLDSTGLVSTWFGRELQHTRGLFQVDPGFVLGVFSADGKWLATGSTNTTIQLWNVDAGLRVRVLIGPPDEALPGTFDLRATRLFSLHRGDGTVVEWNVGDGAWRSVWQIAPAGLGQIRCALSGNDRWLAMAEYGGLIQVVDRVTGTAIRGDLGMTQVSRLALSSDGTLLAATSWKGKAGVWRTATLTPVTTLGPFMHGLFSAAFSPDDQRLAVTSDGPEAAMFYDLTTFREVLSLSAKGAGFRLAGFSSDGAVFGARTAAGRLHLWRAPTRKELSMLRDPMDHKSRHDALESQAR